MARGRCPSFARRAIPGAVLGVVGGHPAAVPLGQVFGQGAGRDGHGAPRDNSLQTRRVFLRLQTAPIAEFTPAVAEAPREPRKGCQMGDITRMRCAVSARVDPLARQRLVTALGPARCDEFVARRLLRDRRPADALRAGGGRRRPRGRRPAGARRGGDRGGDRAERAERRGGGGGRRAAGRRPGGARGDAGAADAGGRRLARRDARGGGAAGGGLSFSFPARRIGWGRISRSSPACPPDLPRPTPRPSPSRDPAGGGWRLRRRPARGDPRQLDQQPFAGAAGRGADAARPRRADRAGAGGLGHADDGAAAALAGRAGRRAARGHLRLASGLTRRSWSNAALSWLLSAYRFDRYKSRAAQKAELVAPGEIDARRVEVEAAAVALTCDLINTPANDMGPEALEAAVSALAEAHGATLSVIPRRRPAGEELPADPHGRPRRRDRPAALDFRWGDEAHRGHAGRQGRLLRHRRAEPQARQLHGADEEGHGRRRHGAGARPHDHGAGAAGAPARPDPGGGERGLRAVLPAQRRADLAQGADGRDQQHRRRGPAGAGRRAGAGGRGTRRDHGLDGHAHRRGAGRASAPTCRRSSPMTTPWRRRCPRPAARVADPLWRLPFWAPYEDMIEPAIADLDNAPQGRLRGRHHRGAVPAPLRHRRGGLCPFRLLRLDPGGETRAAQGRRQPGRAGALRPAGGALRRMSGDPRVTPARGDIAAEHLRGRVTADRFVAPERLRVTAPLLDMTGDAAGEGALTTQLLHGEAFDLYDHDAATGRAWGQCATDGYVGWVDAAGLGPAPEPDARVVTLGTQLYAVPALKARPVGALPWRATVRITERREGHARLACGRWCPLPHLAPLDAAAPDWVAEAERLIGVPYLWGGRSERGLDCSALIQLALAAAGQDCPRDSDMQMALGAPIDRPGRRGDLLFWRGHVGVLRDEATLLHANAHHMAVVSEPLAEARARIEGGPTGPMTAVRRLPA